MKNQFLVPERNWFLLTLVPLFRVRVLLRGSSYNLEREVQSHKFRINKMKQYIVVILIGIAALLQCGAMFQSAGRALADYPNPNLDPLACGRLEVARSSVCDPDKLLSKDDKNLIEGYINKISQAQVAIAVMDKMSMRGLSTTDIDTASERFARGLHDKWGVGDAEKQNGILLFFSISDRAVYISTGSGVQNILTYSTLQGLISNMKPMLRRKKYGIAIADCLIQVDLLLSGKAKSEIFAAYDSKTATPSEEGILEFGLAFTLFLGIIGLGVFCQLRERKDMIAIIKCHHRSSRSDNTPTSHCIPIRST
ncbi:TPM domain-containing protein [archaeon]|nr:MAG: TPM domain-containing protein [archaeon]